MAEDIGSLAVKIALDSTGFEQGMANLKRSLSVMDSEFKKSIAGVKNWGDSVKGLKSQMDTLENKLTVQKQIVKQYTEQLQKSKAALQDNATKMMDLKAKTESANKAWKESQATLGKNAEETKKLKTSYEQLKKEYTDSETKVKNNAKTIEGYSIQVNNATAKLKGMEAQLRNTNKELLLQQSQTIKTGESLERVGKGTQTIGSGVANAGKNLTLALTTPLLGIGAVIAKVNTDFEDGMAKVSTIADTTQLSMKQIQDGVIAVSNATGKGVGDISEGLYDAISSGVATGKSIDFMTTAAKASIGGFTDTKTAVNGLTSVINAYGLSTEKATEIANQMMVAQNLGKTTFGEMAQQMGDVTPISSALNVSTKELFSSLAVLTANGLPTAQAITGIKSAMENVIKPSDAARKAADSVGLDFSASAVKSKGWIGFLQDVKAKLANVAPEYAKASNTVNSLTAQQEALAKAGKKGTDEYKNNAKALAGAKQEMKALEVANSGQLSAFATMFGSVEGLNSVLALTSDQGISLYSESMKQMGADTNYVDDAFNKVNNTSGKRFAMLLNELKNNSMKFKSVFEPAFGKVLDVMEKAVKAITKMDEAQIKNLVTMAGYAAAVGPALIAFGGLIKGFGILETGAGTAMKKVGEFGISGITSIKGFGEKAQLGFLTAQYAMDGFLNKNNVVSKGMKSMVDGVSGNLAKIGGAAKGKAGSFASVFTKGFESLPDGIRLPLTKAGNTIGEFGPVFGAKFKALGGTALSGMQSMLGIAMRLVGPAAIIGLLLVGLGVANQQMGDQLQAILTKVINEGPKLITNFVNGLLTKIPLLIDSGVKLLDSLVKALITNAPVIIQGAAKIIAELVNGVTRNLPTLIPMVINLLMTVLNAIIQNLPLILQAGLQLLLGLVQGIVNNLPMIIQSIVDLIITIVNVVAQNLPLIIQVGIQILVALIQGLAIAIPQIIAAMPQIFSAIWNALITMDWGSIGWAIIQGIGAGIQAAAGGLWETLKSIGSTAISSLKGLLGIASPSKKFRDEVGKWIPAGIAVGIKDNTGVVTKQLSEMSNGMEISPEVKAKMTTSLTSSIGSNLQQDGPQSVQQGATAIGGTQTIVVPVSLDGRVIAEVVAENQKFIDRYNNRSLGGAAAW